MSRFRVYGFFIALGIAVIGWSNPADARSFRVSQVPNGNVNSCGTCHVSPSSGGARNAFGQAIENGFLTTSGRQGQVTWNAQIAGMDSDGDGVSNGQELGDPDGDGTPDASIMVTAPGNPSDFVQVQPPPPPPPTGGGDGNQPPTGVGQADLDGDGQVAFTDFLAWAASSDAGDMDNDGDIDTDDFNVFFNGSFFPPAGDGQPPVVDDGTLLSVESFKLGDVELTEDIANAPLAPGPHVVTFTFNKALNVTFDEDGDPDFENLEFLVVPSSLLEEHASQPTVSEDGLTLTATFDLPEGVTYQLLAGDTDAENFEDISEFFFGTVALPEATVSGSGSLPEDLEGAVVSEEGIALLLDPEILLEVFLEETDDSDGGDAAGKITRAAKVIAQQVQPPPPDGDLPDQMPMDGPDDEGGGDDGIGPFIRPAVRIANLDLDLDFEFSHVPDGSYVMILASTATDAAGNEADLFTIVGINEDSEGPDDLFDEDALVKVEGGQSVTDLAVALELDLEEIYIEEVRVRRVEVENDRFFIRGPNDHPVSVDVSEAFMYTPDGEAFDIDQLLADDIVSIHGLVAGENEILAVEVVGLRRQAPPRVKGIVLDVRTNDGRGRIDITGPQFSFNANTRIVSARGNALDMRDLRPNDRLEIRARDAEDMGRPPRAIEVRLQQPGAPPPPQDTENGFYVGTLARIDFDNNRFVLQVSYGFNQNTRLIDRNGGEITIADIVPQSRVQVTALPTDAGLAFARTIRLLRGAGEQIPERITDGVFVTAQGDLDVDRAFAVPLDAELRLRFDAPLTDETKDLVEIFVYEAIGEDGSEEGGEDVALTTEVVDGELKVTMTLKPDTFYEAFAAIEEGNEVFGIFTTALELPKLEAVSSSPSNGDVNVATETTLSVTLNSPVASEDDEVFAYITVLPTPLSGEIESEDLELSEDGLTISVDVVLEADRTYLAVLEDAYDDRGFRLDRLYKARFSTGATIGTGTVSGNFVLPPGNVIDPAKRNAIGFVGLIPSDTDFENLEGDEEDRIGVGFDVTTSGDFSIESVPAGSYIVAGFAFFEAGGDGGEGVGLVGEYLDENGDIVILEVAEGGMATGVEIQLGSSLELKGSRPEPGKGGVGSGRQTLALQFSEPLQANRGNLALNVEIDPPIEGFDARRDLRRSPDNPRRIEARVNLEPDTDYVMLVLWAQGVSGAELDDVIEIPFSTRATFSGGSISGAITLSDGSTAKGEVTLGNLTDQKRAGEVNIRRDGTFNFKNVRAGTYGLFLSLKLSDGRTISGLLDSDGDGDPDPLVLEAGGSIADLAIAITVPEVTATPEPGASGGNDSATLAFDFGSGSGNDGQTTGQVTAGEAFSVSVYVDGTQDLIGYEVVVAYDKDKVALKSVLEQTSAEGANYLKTAGGLGAFIGRVGDGTATLTAVILGPSEKVAPEGGGLLGVLEFEALSDFSGETDLTIQTAVMTGVSTVSDSLTSDAKGTVSGVELTKTLGVSIDPSLIAADGSAEATVTVQILDTSGVLQSDDNTTVVTLATSGGTLGSTEVTAASGVATTTISSSTAGTLTITASTTGAIDQTATVVAQSTSTDVSSGPAGPVALDLDLTAGDQAQRQSSTTPNAGDIVEIDLVAVSGALEATGVSVTLSFDANALAFKGFTATDIFSSALPITVPTSGSVQINLALLGGSGASKDAGSIGTLSFTVQSGFSTSTAVVLTAGEYGTASGTSTLSIGSGGATVIFGGTTSAAPSPDLNGDGTVGFPDFLIFATAFGKTSAQEGFNASADLNSDGAVGFPDFLIFATAFGKPAKPALSKPLGIGALGVNNVTGIDLIPRAGVTPDLLDLSVRLRDAIGVQGYGLRVAFDATKLEFLGTRGIGPSLLVENAEQGAALVTIPAEGEAMVADAFGSLIEGNGELVILQFRVLDPAVPGQVEIAEAVVSDGNGLTNVLGAYLAEVRAMPVDYALGQNFPNPFNPETQIAYQLPESAKVSLIVYNLLGQQVRELVNGSHEAGFYRVNWDGKDAIGRSVGSGIYFAHMRSGTFSNVKKMLLLK